jgi:hypothetical protein
MTETKKKLSIKERLQEHIAEYGALALTIFLLIFALTYLGFFVAIKSGADIGDSAAGSTGTFVAAWLATKLTMPLRVGATLVLTPLAAAGLHRIRGTVPAPAQSPTPDQDES